jgi:hypothetical protein
LKVGSDAINLNFYPGPFSAQLLITPTFEPDNLPTGQRLFFFNPLLSGQAATTIKPSLQFENFEVAGRVYKNVSQFDLSLYAYRGLSPSPAIQTLGEFFFPELRVYGASAQGAFLGGIVSLEGGYYDAAEDRDGTNPFIENPEIRFLVGYQRAIGADLSVGLQYYSETMLKFNAYESSLPPDIPKANQIRHNITFRATQFLSYQTLRFSLFAWVSPNDEEAENQSVVSVIDAMSMVGFTKNSQLQPIADEANERLTRAIERLSNAG